MTSRRSRRLGTVTYKGTTDARRHPADQAGLDLHPARRDTGVPLIPVVERKVPQGGAFGEQLSPTQPFPVAPTPLAPSSIKPDQTLTG